MPKKPIDFSKTIIYKIWKDDDFYVGSTTDFSSRKTKHKHKCNDENAKEYNFKLYQTIREKGGWDTWEMTPLEEYDCKSKTQARIREEEWRIKLNATLNAKKAYCSEEEIKAYNKQYMTQYRQENAEEIKAYNKQYYQKHTEELKAKKTEKFECECGGKYTYNSKTKHERTLKHQAYLVKL
jgi:hypothetical protein